MFEAVQVRFQVYQKNSSAADERFGVALRKIWSASEEILLLIAFFSIDKK